MPNGYASLMGQYQRAQEGARIANLRRAQQIQSIYGEVVRRYEPGGPFEKRGVAMLEKQKRRDVGAEMQQMISSGLYGTTTAAGAPRRWEEAVGEPGRMRLEDIMMQRLSQAQIGQAGFMERIEQPYPDYGMLMGAMAQPGAQAAAPQRSLAEFMQEFRGEGRAPARPVAPAGERAYARPAAQETAEVTTTGQVSAAPTVEQAAGVPTSLAVGTEMGRILGKPSEGDISLMQSAFQKYQTSAKAGTGAGLSEAERRVMRQYRGKPILKQIWGQS